MNLPTGRPLIRQHTKKSLPSLSTMQAEIGPSGDRNDLGVEKIAPIGCSVIHYDGNERSVWLIGRQKGV